MPFVFLPMSQMIGRQTAGEGVDGGHHGARDLLGALHGDALGHHLGDHDGTVGDDEGQDDVHQAAGDAGCTPQLSTAGIR